MTQMKTRQGSLKKAMQSAGFVRGYNDVLKGKPFNYDAMRDKGIDQQWNYERGRLFGLTYKGPLKNGARVEWAAIRAMSALLSERIAL